MAIFAQGLFISLIIVGSLALITMSAFYLGNRYSDRSPIKLDRKRSKILTDDIIRKIKGNYHKIEYITNFRISVDSDNTIRLCFRYNDFYLRCDPVYIEIEQKRKPGKSYYLNYKDSMRVLFAYRKWRKQKQKEEKESVFNELDEAIVDITTDTI